MPRQAAANDHQVGGQHYRATIQVWDAIVAWHLGFLDGNVVKYVARYRLKHGVEDLRKARHYLDKLIEVESVAEKLRIRRARKARAARSRSRARR